MRDPGLQAEHDATEDVGGESLLSVGLLEGLLPVDRSELQHAALRPTRQKAEEVAHVGKGLDPVQSAAGQQGYEDGVDLGAVVTAHEEPIAATHDLPAQVQFAPIVVDGQIGIFEKSRQRRPLVARVPYPVEDGRLFQDPFGFALALREEGVDHGFRSFQPEIAFLLPWRLD